MRVRPAGYVVQAPDPVGSRHGRPRPLPAPFVIGAARSGTTLLRLMLDAHPDLAVPPETKFVPGLIKAARQPGATADTLAEMLVGYHHWPRFGLDADDMRARFRALRPFDVSEAIRAFYMAYAEKQGKPRWGDKTPHYSREMKPIDRHLPEAHFIHLIRDGRDVCLSRLARLRRGGEPPPPASHHARHWQSRVQAARRRRDKVGHYIEVRYEDLILDTDAQLRRICEYLELTFDPGMLRYHQRAPERMRPLARTLPGGGEADPLRPKVMPDSRRRAMTGEDRLVPFRLTSLPPQSDRVERWRTEMPPRDRAEFEAVAGALLVELGYEVGTPKTGSQRA